MLTPIDIQNKTLKTGMGYNKKDVDDFLIQIIRSYEELYKQNVEFKEKIGTLSEGIQYYKSIETTLQKALVLAEKTSKETKEAAMMKAEALEKDARVKADQLLADAKNELDSVRNQTITLVQSYESFRLQFKKLAATQLELVEGDGFKIYAPELEKFMNGTSDDLQSEALLASISQAQEAQDSATAELEAVNKNIAESISKLNASIAESEAALAQSSAMSASITPDMDMTTVSAGLESMTASYSTPMMTEPSPVAETPMMEPPMTEPPMTEPLMSEPLMSEPLTSDPMMPEQSVSIGSMLQQQSASIPEPTVSTSAYDTAAAPTMSYTPDAITANPYEKPTHTQGSEIYTMNDMAASTPVTEPAAAPTQPGGDSYLDELRFDGMSYTAPTQPAKTEPAGQGGEDIQFEFISTEE